MKKSIVYKVTFPNGKVYIGQDTTETMFRYVGSFEEKYVQKDFTWEEMQDITLRKKVLWSSDCATRDELNQKEKEYILKCDAMNPEKGYNLRL